MENEKPSACHGIRSWLALPLKKSINGLGKLGDRRKIRENDKRVFTEIKTKTGYPMVEYCNRNAVKSQHGSGNAGVVCLVGPNYVS